MNNYKNLKNVLKDSKNNIDGLELIESDKGKNGLFFKKEGFQSNREFVKKTFCSDMNDKVFNDLYDQAIGGSGAEDSNMNNVMSSALFCFLFFSKVSSNNPIKIDGNYYSHVCFEYKNRTLKGNTDFAPSNIDVVLATEDYKNIMFIESKFGEYYYSLKNSYDGLSMRYYKEGNTREIIEFLKKENLLTIDESKNLIVFKDADKKKRHYYEGLKQMITHISGLNNYKQNVHCACNTAHLYDKEKLEIQKAFNQKNIFLQEIIFDLNQSFNLGEEEINDYIDLHNKLIAGVKKSNIKNIDVKDILTYQSIVSKNDFYIKSLDPKILKLYNLNCKSEKKNEM